MVLTLLACTPPAPPIVEPEKIGDSALLHRASLDLRGRRATEAEMDAVQADPTALPPLIDTFVLDDGFPERLVFLYNEVFRTRADRYLVSFDNDVDFLDSATNLAFRHSVGEEPLRLLAYVAANDLPYTDIVTADYTMANPLLIEHLPLELLDTELADPEDVATWRRARYLDERPAVGVLGTSGMWWRYTSTYQNANRGRAMAIGRCLLCDDRFEAAVSFQGDTVDLEERITTDAACISCHSTLDPLGGYLWGFVSRNQEAWLEVTRYYTAQETAWEETTGVAPGFYGDPGDTLSDLGTQIA